MRKKPKFRVGQVVKFKKRMELNFYFGKIVSDYGTLRDYSDSFNVQGYSIVSGGNIFAIPENAIHPLTVREKG